MEYIRGMERKRMSLSWELGELKSAIEAARILIEELDSEQLANKHSEKVAPQAATAVLTLVGGRLEDLCRVLAGELDPSQMFGQHNDKPRIVDDDAKDPDLYLNAWESEESMTEVTRLCRQIAQAQPSQAVITEMIARLWNLVRSLDLERRTGVP